MSQSPARIQSSAVIAVLFTTFTVVGVLAIPKTAQAIPSFARKYETSCQTCHTVYPKLNPFGEAFRRNGFRFPGDDRSMTRDEPVSMGSDAYKKLFPNAVWPSTLPGDSPLSFAVNGGITLHPDTSSAAAQADDGMPVIMSGLVDEAALFAGGSFDDKDTFFAETVIGGDGVELEHALILLNDIAGPAHALNVVVGRVAPTTSSYAMHSTYVADASVPKVATSALFGRDGESAWTFDGNFNLIELNGLVGGRVSWSAGLSDGANEAVHAPQDVYVHIGTKLGGIRMDGEGDTAADSMKPWAEKAVTVDLAGGHSSSEDGDGNVDVALVFGGSLRAQYQSLELSGGILTESHDNVDGAGLGASTFNAYDELSYVVYPWLVPALRFDYIQVSPDGEAAVSNYRLTPGVAALIRTNLKLVVTGTIEGAQGAPPAGWEAAGGSVEPSAPDAAVSPELASMNLGLHYAY